MSNMKYIVVVGIVGLGLAYFVGSPLRKPAADAPKVGAPLQSAQVYAQGTITLAPALQAKAAAYPALFLFARAPGSRAPIAVKRIVSPSFPLTFVLSEDDNMAGDGFYDGDITVVARLDQDGAAGAKQTGDFEGLVDIKKGASRDISVEITP